MRSSSPAPAPKANGAPKVDDLDDLLNDVLAGDDDERETQGRVIPPHKREETLRMEDGSKLVHSKHFRWPDGSHPKNPHIVRMGVMFAILASVITIYLHLIPEADAVRASTPLMIIMGSIQVHNSAVYGLIAFCVFVVVSLYLPQDLAGLFRREPK